MLDKGLSMMSPFLEYIILRYQILPEIIYLLKHIGVLNICFMSVTMNDVYISPRSAIRPLYDNALF